MEENKSSVKPTVIKSITAIICSAVLAFTSSSITGKVCDNKKEIASKGGTAASSSVTGDTAGSADDIFSDDAGAVSDDTGADMGEDLGGDISDDTGADIGGSTGDTGSSSTGSSSSGKSSSGSSSKKAAAKEITLTSGLNSTNKAEVLKYYKLVAAKNAKGTYVTKMSMKSLDGGKGGVGALISAFKPIAVSALEKNSTTTENIPGAYDKLVEDDWEKATAVNDGTYTTITVQVKNQKDGANGKTQEGHVGHSIGVLDGVQTALDQLSGVSADFANSNFYLLYDNAYIKVKVKNSTGEFVKGACTWHYNVNVNLDNLTVKVTFISATLNGGKGVVDYTITY